MRNASLIFFSCFTLFAWGQDSTRIVRGTIQQELIWNDQDTLESTIDFAYFDPALDPAEIEVNQMIHEAHELWLLDSSRVSAKLSRAFFESLLNDFHAVSRLEPDQYNQGWVLEMSTDITPFDHFVQVSISGWEYAGGVHGNGTYFAWLFSREDGHRLELDEIFSDLNAVTALFESYFRTLMELSPEASLNEAEFWFDDDRFVLNDNYFLRGNEFIVYFNTYEISSYAMGPIEIAVPLEELKDFLILEF